MGGAERVNIPREIFPEPANKESDEIPPRSPARRLRVRLRGPVAVLLLAALSQAACKKEEQNPELPVSENTPAQVNYGSLDT